jgi:hypothetical protein
MRGRGALTAAACALLLVPAAASAAPPEGAQMSSNLEYVTRVADTRQVVEGKFDTVKGKDVLVLTGRFGFKTLDVSDPTNPKAMDSFLPADLNPGGYWQNEDMELDTKRKLIIGALDPRHTELGATNTSPCPPGGGTADPDCRSGFYVISYADPKNLKQVGDFVELPSGHTSSCIQDCKYIWTGGPARRNNPEHLWLGPILGPNEPPPWTFNRLVGDGRPIWVTDLRDPKHPEVSDQPVDIWRNDGFTDYSHDVDEDERGIAWVSGRGGVRGYATEGYHRDPFQNRYRKASPFDPILVAGGGVGGTAQPVMLMHNSGRPTDGSVRASGVKNGNVLVGTEEDFTGCATAGKIVLSDLSDSWGGEPASRSTLNNPYRMKPLDTFHPVLDSPEGDTSNSDCSAHYFEIEGPLLGAGWYGQGLRLVDISNARDVRQVGFFRVTGTSDDNPSSNSWDMAFYDWGRKSKYKSHRRGSDLIYLFDMSRGVEVLRLKGGAKTAAKMKKVSAPTRRKSRWDAKAVGALASVTNADGSVSYVCPLFQ